MKNPAQKHSQSHMGMMVLCVALIGGAFFFFSGPGLEGSLSLSILVPLVICVGAHFLMHRFMGHDGNKANPHEQKKPGRLANTNTKTAPPHVSIPNRSHTA